jgi:hypothetical protein
MDVKDLNAVANEIGLTEKQKAFAENYVFVTGLDANAAVELAGYKVEYDYEGYSEETAEVFKYKRIASLVRELLNNKKVLTYIKILREELENQLLVDKLWVIKKLKTLATQGSENVQLKATELLGKHLEMFTERQKIEGVEDPAVIVKKAFEIRKKREKENIIEFKKDGTDECS